MKHKIFLALSFFTTFQGMAQLSADRWTGFYIGPSLGIATGKSSFSEGTIAFYQMSGVYVKGRGIVIVPGTNRSFPGASGSNTSFSGGIQFGYMKQIKHFVIGLESTINYSGFKGSQDYDSIMPPTVLVYSCNYGIHRSVSAPWMESVGLKLGYEVKRSLIYFTASKNFANVKIKTADTYESTFWPQPPPDNNTHPTPTTDKFVTSDNNAVVKTTFSPFCFGIGYEWAMNDFFTLGITYTHYKSFSIDFQPNHTDTTNLTPDNRISRYGSMSTPSQKITMSQSRVLITLNFNMSRLASRKENKLPGHHDNF